MFSRADAFVTEGNVTINSGKFIIRSEAKSIKVNGIFLINGGKVFVASLDEIQKPNANSLQKTLLLNFKESRDKLLFFHDKTKVVFVYAGGINYQHILYSNQLSLDTLAK